MFSVIIPLYNKANYILKAVDSVLLQTYPEFELIIVNDGSTDNSLEIVNKIKDKRIRVIDQLNVGVSVARNNGVAAAKYDYIAFLDADDWWATTFLEEMKSLIENYPDAGIYGSKYYWIKNNQKRVSINHESDNYIGYINYYNAYTYAWWMPLTSISIVIPKYVFEEFNGFNPSLTFGEDFDLWIKIVLKYKVAYTNKPLAYYNQDVNINERALGANKKWAWQNHFIFNLGYLDSAKSNNPDLAYLIEGILVRSLHSFYLSGQHKEKVYALLKSVDFSVQPRYYRFIYKYPKPLVRLFFKGKQLGSRVKQFLLLDVKA